MRCLVLAVALLVGCAKAYPCKTRYAPSVVAGRPFLWEVRGPHGAVVMFGTYHAASEGDVPAAAWDALARSTVFVAEVDEVEEDERDSPEIYALLHLPPEVTLRSLLGRSDYERLTSLLFAEISIETLRTMKPWVAMILLAKKAFEFPSTTISEALLERARARKLRTDFLDSFADQARFLDESAGTIKLVEAIDKYPQMECSLTRRVEAYRAGDDIYFTSDIPDTGDPIMRRLQRWSVRIENYLVNDERAFVAIGTATLMGPHGLLATLQGKGYEVRRLDRR